MTFLLLLQLLAAQMSTNVVYCNSLVVLGPGTNNWLVLSNGAIWMPPFTFQSEDGGDGQRGGIYFSYPGRSGPNAGDNFYLLNLSYRGPFGGQLLLSHQSIYLEEQTLGSICFGNDGSSGGLIEIRYDDAMGHNLQTNIPGHAHVLLFSPRLLQTNGETANANPGIIAFHGGGPANIPGDPDRGWGPVSLGELAFYTSIAWPGYGSILHGGVEMGRMKTNGWSFGGSFTRSRRAITNLSSYCFINLNLAYLTDITLTTNTVIYSSTPALTNNEVQSSVVLLRAGPQPIIVRCPMWKVRQSPFAKAAMPLPSNSTLWIDLDTVLGETYATFSFAMP